MQFTRQVREVNNTIIITIPSSICKCYDINPKDFCTLEFIKNLRDGNNSK